MYAFKLSIKKKNSTGAIANGGSVNSHCFYCKGSAETHHQCV